MHASENRSPTRLPLWQRFVNLLLYGNYWIGACALAMVLQTQYLIAGRPVFDHLSLFLFAGTWSLYSFHRIVGMGRVRPFHESGRYRIIYRFRRHITLYALVGAALAAYAFFQLPRSVQISTIVPTLLSLGYVFPWLRGKRLRDFDFWKIFLVAGAFSWLTVGLPWLEPGFESVTWWQLAERFCFIFALTLPFDIRDLRIDAHTKVQTIPALLGESRSRLLAYLLLVLSLSCSAACYALDFYSVRTLLALLLLDLTTALLIRGAHRERPDHYFTGYLDGLMILSFLLVWGIQVL